MALNWLVTSWSSSSARRLTCSASGRGTISGSDRSRRRSTIAKTGRYRSRSGEARSRTRGTPTRCRSFRSRQPSGVGSGGVRVSRPAWRSRATKARRSSDTCAGARGPEGPRVRVQVCLRAPRAARAPPGSAAPSAPPSSRSAWPPARRGPSSTRADRRRAGKPRQCAKIRRSPGPARWARSARNVPRRAVAVPHECQGQRMAGRSHPVGGDVTHGRVVEHDEAGEVQPLEPAERDEAVLRIDHARPAVHGGEQGPQVALAARLERRHHREARLRCHGVDQNLRAKSMRRFWLQ